MLMLTDLLIDVLLHRRRLWPWSRLCIANLGGKPFGWHLRCLLWRLLGWPRQSWRHIGGLWLLHTLDVRRLNMDMANWKITGCSSWT